MIYIYILSTKSSACLLLSIKCVHACMHACVRACVRACVCMRACMCVYCVCAYMSGFVSVCIYAVWGMVGERGMYTCMQVWGVGIAQWLECQNG